MIPKYSQSGAKNRHTKSLISSFYTPDLALSASKLEAMLKRASKGESSFDFPLCRGLVTCSWFSASSLWSQGLTIPGLPLWRAAVLWDKISSIQKDLTPAMDMIWNISHVSSCLPDNTFLLGRVLACIVGNYLRHSSHITITIFRQSFQRSTHIISLLSIYNKIFSCNQGLK